MKLSREFDPIRNWAQQRGIDTSGTAESQFLKLLEEVGELSQAIQKKDKEELVDAIGDCVVVLTNLALINNLKIEDCINSAFQIINVRSGKMINGTFVKNL
jgi:NTP pyrophosphatase (non-canonical NTP hydrolase)